MPGPSGEELSTAKGHRGIFSSDGNVLSLDCGGGDSGVHISQNPQTCTVKWVHFITCNYTSKMYTFKKI